MQNALRPYATAGVALVGASVIAVTPVAAPLPQVQARSVQLVDAWSDLLTDTTANLTNIANNADPTAIAGVFQALLSNPIGVIQALTSLDPTVTTELGSLPATIDVQFPPGLELILAQLGAEGATLNAINDVVAQLATNPAGAFNTLLEAPATIGNAFLNGEDNISLLNGIVNIAGFNGILAPLQDVSINLNLVSLLDALGLGNLDLSNIDLTSLLSQLGLGDLNLGGLLGALGISGDGLGTLLGNPTLSSLLGDLGLGGLNLGGLNLTDLLGLDGNVSLDNLGLNTVLNAFGIDGTVNLGLSDLLKDLGFTNFVNEGLGTVLGNPGINLLSGLLGSLNTTIGGTLNNVPGVGAILGALLNNVLSPANLETALNTIKVGDLLGGQSIDTSVSNLLGSLGVAVPDNLNIGTILTDLGFPATTGALSLDDLLSGLGLGDLSVGSLLNTVNLGELIGDLGLSNLPLDLTNLGDLTDLTLGGLLGDLGLGDIAGINIDGFGGLATLLTDVIPQQVLAALGG